VRLAGAQLAADALDEHGAVLFGERVFALLGRQIGVQIFQLLCGDEGDMAVQQRRIAQLGILAAHGQLRVADAGDDARHSLMQREEGARFRCDDLLPIPLIDVDGVQVIQLLVAADGVHVGVNALAGMDVVAVERHALPLGQRMNDLRVCVRARNIESDRAFHAVEVVVQAGIRLDEQRRGHAAQIQFAGKRILKHALD